MKRPVTTMRQWLINRSQARFRDSPRWAAFHDAEARRRGLTRKEYIEANVDRIVHEDDLDPKEWVFTDEDDATGMQWH